MILESPTLAAWRTPILNASNSGSLTEQKPPDKERIKIAELSLMMPWPLFNPSSPIEIKLNDGKEGFSEV